MPSHENIFQESEELYNAKQKYQVGKIQTVEYLNNVLFYIYIILIIVLVYFCYINTNMNKYIKIAIILGFIVYPFIILPFETIIYSKLILLENTMLGKPNINKKHSPIV
jgi:hypothetical protein